MSTEAFEEFCFRVSCLDYAKMDTAMDPLVELMQGTGQVHIVGPGTDLTFSIKGMPANKRAGKLNVPDARCSPLRYASSANGTITYNAPSLVDGVTFENVSLTFEQGRIVNATGTPLDKLTARLNRRGSTLLGEFALGVNPFITYPMKDILYDEKIAGSLHLDPWECLQRATVTTGIAQAIHWDLVLIQTPEWGGGEIWFDGVLVRKDGLFVLGDWKITNPGEAGLDVHVRRSRRVELEGGMERVTKMVRRSRKSHVPRPAVTHIGSARRILGTALTAKP